MQVPTTSGNKGKRLWSDPKSIGITGFFSFANWKKRQKWPSDTKLIPLPLRHRIMSKHPKALKFVFLWTNLRAFFYCILCSPSVPTDEKIFKNFSDTVDFDPFEIPNQWRDFSLHQFRRFQIWLKACLSEQMKWFVCWGVPNRKLIELSKDSMMRWFDSFF